MLQGCSTCYCKKSLAQLCLHVHTLPLDWERIIIKEFFPKLRYDCLYNMGTSRCTSARLLLRLVESRTALNGVKMTVADNTNSSYYIPII